ncbi:MAG: hypothetical protein Tsb009_18080 [Planctomycetaceae bacterium]
MLTRREFLAGSLSLPFLSSYGLADPSSNVLTTASKRPRVAAIITELRFRSHAYNILENFFKPYYFNGKLTDPGCEIVSLYADQFPKNDMARAVSRRFHIPLFKTIGEAVCLGSEKFAVDAVLSIGEHGDYPYNKWGQKMYPRKRFFDEITKSMIAANRFAPIFNDKHLSYRWDWAKQMYDTTRKHGIPFQAGSSVPLAQRVPAMSLPNDAEITEAVSIHGGGFESYDFHGLEVLQSFVESRRGGETGISEVELLTGDALKRAIKTGRISKSLIDAAMQAESKAKFKRRPYPGRSTSRTKSAKQKVIPNLKRPKGPHAIALTYKDGFRATVMTVGSSANRWNFACRLKGEKKVRATALYNGPWGNRCLFKALSHSIQHLFKTGKQPYPVERTLIVTGALEAAVRSFNNENHAIKTPHLEFSYQPIDFSTMRESGKSWKKITIETPQPLDFSPGDAKLKTS